MSEVSVTTDQVRSEDRWARGGGFSETNHHGTGRETRRKCSNGASSQAVPALTPAFSVNKNETTFPVPRPIRWGCNSEKDPTDYRLWTWNSLADVF